jgi:general secretion pathway protein G
MRQKDDVILSGAKDPCFLFGVSQPSRPECPIPGTLIANRYPRRALVLAGLGEGEATSDDTRISAEQGFTLLELMIVMVVIGLLAAIAIPAYTSNIRNAKEAVLKEDLHTMRQAIDSYTVDKAKAPQSLDDLVQAGYLKAMPVDPFTHRSDTWMPVQDDTLSSIDQTDSGIDDVHSGAQQTASDGTSYSTW